MRWWTAPTKLYPYSFEEVVSVFWDRYPNSFAPHIISEDVLEREVTEHTIVTKKLIVKHGMSFIKRLPRWLVGMTDVRVIPVIEESVYDKRERTLVTYTRNVSHKELFSMHERCIYRPSNEAYNFTDILRSVYVRGAQGKMSSFIERLMVLRFRTSIMNTCKGFAERLEERFGVRNLSNIPYDKMKKIKEKILKSPFVSEIKCEEK